MYLHKYEGETSKKLLNSQYIYSNYTYLTALIILEAYLLNF
jgi:hypothetical protein